MEDKSKPNLRRTLIIAACALMLGFVYIFQRWNYLEPIARLLGYSEGFSSSASFVIVRTVRLIVNDSICLLLIRTLFADARYTRIAAVVFCFELFVLLPVYLIAKLMVEGPTEISSPLLSPIHRLIVNPMLMFILILAFYYQRFLHLRRL